jgi:hypothetical protein
MVILVVIIIIIGFAGMIGNQKSGLKRMDEMQRSLDDINQKLREMKNNQ